MRSVIYSVAKRIAIIFYHVLNTVLRIKQSRIVFSSSVGKSYSGNPKAIYEYMVECSLDSKFECIWFYERHPFEIPGNAKQAKMKGLLYIVYMATAGVWIFDSRQPSFLRKRPECRYIQTWHGTPLKKLGLDMDTVHMSDTADIDKYHAEFAKNAHTWDYLISQNPFSTKTFRRCFDFKGEMLEYGYPRNDVLIKRNTKEDKEILRKSLLLPRGKKVLLYAPTWRDDEYSAAQRYDFRPKMNFDLMMRELSDEYVMIVKYHYLIMDVIDWSLYDGFIYSVEGDKDIAELYLVADAMITDYSSVMFDYSILRRPMYFFAYDLDKYRGELRGFYFDYEKEMPGPISETTEELIDHIKNIPKSAYDEKYQAFVKKYDPFDDGRASKKVVELITQDVSKKWSGYAPINQYFLKK